MKNRYQNSRRPTISICSLRVNRSKSRDCQTVLKKIQLHAVYKRQVLNSETQIDQKLKEFKSYTPQIVTIKELKWIY